MQINHTDYYFISDFIFFKKFFIINNLATSQVKIIISKLSYFNDLHTLKNKRVFLSYKFKNFYYEIENIVYYYIILI